MAIGSATSGNAASAQSAASLQALKKNLDDQKQTFQALSSGTKKDDSSEISTAAQQLYESSIGASGASANAG